MADTSFTRTDISVVMSRTFQPGQMQPWLNLTDRVRILAIDVPLTLERTF